MKHYSRIASLDWILLIVFSLAFQNQVCAQTRFPIPSETKQKEIAKLISETYSLGRLDSTAKKLDAAKRLLEATGDDSLTADDRYVILATLIPLARDAGDFEVWQQGVASLVDSFEVDPQKERSRLLGEFLGAAKSLASMRPAVEEAVSQARAAAQENRFPAAMSILATADTAIRRVNSTASLRPLVTDARSAIAVREKDWKSFQESIAKLATAADDPAANYGVGRWHALQKGDWQTALPYLAKGGNAKWKGAAGLEVTTPTDAISRAAVGDAWWEIGQAESGTNKSMILVHAGEFYEAALPELASVRKQLVTKRLDEIAPLKSAVPSQAIAPVAEVDEKVKAGEWIDLLRWSEEVDWSRLQNTKWNGSIEAMPNRNGITMKRAPGARFPLPAVVNGDYEMEVKFARIDGNGDVSIDFPVGVHMVTLLLGTGKDAVAKVQYIDNKVGAERRAGEFSNNRPHRILIRVRHDHYHASFNIDCDNVKDYFKWDGLYDLLAVDDPSKHGATIMQHPCLGGHETAVTFQKVRIRTEGGTIRRDPICNSVRERDLKDGFIRLVGIKENSRSSFGGDFSVNQLGITAGWPRFSREFKLCDDYYGAHADSRITCPIPKGAKSFTVWASNAASGSTRYSMDIDGQPVYHSGIVNTALIKVNLPANSSSLQLVADACGVNMADQVYWCYPRFHSVSAERILDQMLDEKPEFPFAISSSSVAAGTLTRNESLGIAPVHFRSAEICQELIYTHAPATIAYDVPDGMTRFTAIGFTPLSRHAKYEVWADGKRVYESSIAGRVSIDAKLPRGTRSIELKINDLGDSYVDQSFWCYPRLYKN